MTASTRSRPWRRVAFAIASLGLGCSWLAFAQEPRASSAPPSATVVPVPSHRSTAANSTSDGTVVPGTSGAPLVGPQALEKKWGVPDLERRLERLRSASPTPSASTPNLERLQQRVDELKRQARSASERLGELRATRTARRSQSLAELERKWGAGALAERSVRAELATHARRVARLERAKTIAAQSGRDDDERRASALLAREDRRHSQAMAGLVRPTPAPAGSP
jgi:hypothetical protein